MEYSVLILVHVICAVIWGGGVIFMGFYLVPAILEAGPGGGAVMAGVMKRKLPVLMTLMGALAALSGLRLYALRFSMAWLGTPEGICLTLGGLLALSALGMGFARQRPLGMKMAQLAKEGRGAEIPPIAAELGRVARVVAWHAVGIIVLMAGHGLAAQL